MDLSLIMDNGELTLFNFNLDNASATPTYRYSRSAYHTGLHLGCLLYLYFELGDLLNCILFWLQL